MALARNEDAHAPGGGGGGIIGGGRSSSKGKGKAQKTEESKPQKYNVASHLIHLAFVAQATGMGHAKIRALTPGNTSDADNQPMLMPIHLLEPLLNANPMAGDHAEPKMDSIKILEGVKGKSGTKAPTKKQICAANDTQPATQIVNAINQACTKAAKQNLGQLTHGKKWCLHGMATTAYCMRFLTLSRISCAATAYSMRQPHPVCGHQI